MEIFRVKKLLKMAKKYDSRLRKNEEYIPHNTTLIKNREGIKGEVYTTSSSNEDGIKVYSSSAC